MAIIEVDGLSKSYGGAAALKGVSFSVDKGEIFGVIGANGAGKTTLIECIEGLRRPDEGSARVLGLDPQRDHGELRQRIGVQLQESALPDALKVGEALDLYASFYRNPMNWRSLMEQWGLGEKSKTAFSALSGGQKQRLFIALALIGNPEVAFLDEVTTGLDPQARRNTWSMIRDIRDRGVTVVLVTHFMDEAEHLCDRVLVLDGGQVVALDSPAGLVGQAQDERCVWFRPLGAFDLGLLTGLPGVQGVDWVGDQVLVNGDEHVFSVVTAALARHNIVASELRTGHSSLDEAFVALTGQVPAPPTKG